MGWLKGLMIKLNRTLAQQLAIVTAKDQRDWDAHVPLVLMAYRSAAQDSTACSPALRMLGREIRTPADMVVGRPPDASLEPPGLEYARKLQDRLDRAHEFARDQLRVAGARQKRNYDVRARGKQFEALLTWSGPTTRRGGGADARSWTVNGRGPCRVVERLGEVVYRVRLPPRGRRVALHRDRLAPYRGAAVPVQPTSGPRGTRDTASGSSPATLGCSDTTTSSPGLWVV